MSNRPEVLKMKQFKRVCFALETRPAGFYIANTLNGRVVEVTNMAGGRYLCIDPDGEPVKQTDESSVAYHFLMSAPELDNQRS